MWVLYEFLLFISLLLFLPKALWRRRLPHRGWTMRLGRYPEAVHKRLGRQQAIWVHAVSVGEVIAVHPLIRRLTAEYPTVPLVLSTVTPSGFAVASKLLGEDGVTIYAPLYFRLTVQRALQTIQPRMLVLAESELWPNTLAEIGARGIPAYLVNARLSDRALRGWQRWPGKMAMPCAPPNASRPRRV